MYQAILFDIGGVLVDFDPKEYLMERFMRTHVEEILYDITFGSPEWAALDAGTMTRYQAERIMLEKAEKVGYSYEVKEILYDWLRILRPRQKVLELVRKLKKNGYKLYYLSNIAPDTLEYVKKLGVLDDFDGGLASFEIQHNKPDPVIYRTLLKRYDLDPKTCIFIDDSDVNVRAAYNLGITSVALHRSVNALLRNLRSCGINLK